MHFPREVEVAGMEFKNTLLGAPQSIIIVLSSTARQGADAAGLDRPEVVPRPGRQPSRRDGLQALRQNLREPAGFSSGHANGIMNPTVPHRHHLILFGLPGGGKTRIPKCLRPIAPLARHCCRRRWSRARSSSNASKTNRKMAGT